MFSTWWTVVLESSWGNGMCRDGESLCPYTGFHCLCIWRSLFSRRVMARAHVQTMISVVSQFTELNRWPVLWLWPEVLVPATQPSRRPYGSVGWSLLPLVPSSLPVTWFARGLTLPWSLTSDDCVPCLFVWNLSDFASTGFCSKHTYPAMISILIRSWDVWKHSICIPAAVSTCIHLTLVHQCYHCCWLELSFHPKLYQTRQDWLSVNTYRLVLIILSFNSLLLSPVSHFVNFSGIPIRLWRVMNTTELLLRWKSSWLAVLKVLFNNCCLMFSCVMAGVKITLRNTSWIFNWLFSHAERKYLFSTFTFLVWILKISPFPGSNESAPLLLFLLFLM